MKDVAVPTPQEKIQQSWLKLAYEDIEIPTIQWLLRSKVTSPIEKIMAEALVATCASHLEIYRLAQWMIFLDDSHRFIDDPYDNCIFQIAPQVPIEGYVADFMIRCWLLPDKPIIIECDGHDFHEKTKKQAAHDKRRDRVLQTSGYLVLRFTGSEIYNDPVGCAAEVFDYFATTVGNGDWSAGAKIINDRAEELWVGR